MVRVVFLGGLGRSGTTLLERILGEIPGVCALGEVVHLWQRDIENNESCACGTPFHDCAFWTAVGQRAFGGWDRVDVGAILALRDRVERTRHIPALAAAPLARTRAEHIRAYARFYTRVYTAAAEASGASVIVDSSKHSALAHCLRWSDVDLRVVHVVRDSRGVAYSWTKHVSRPEVEAPGAGVPVRRPESRPEPAPAGAERGPQAAGAVVSPRSAGDEEMTRYAPARSAMLWTAHNAAFGLLGRCGVPVRRIRYETLVSAPRATVAAIAAFAGIGLTSSDLDFIGTGTVRLRTCHSAAGNPMRFRTGEIPLRHDDAWVAALPPGQRRLVGAITAPMLGAYGYRISGRR